MGANEEKDGPAYTKVFYTHTYLTAVSVGKVLDQ